jgi:hypothetical protein
VWAPGWVRRAPPPRGQEQIEVGVRAVDAIQGVVRKLNLEIEVARLTGADSRAALTDQANLLTGADTLGDTHVQGMIPGGHVPVFRQLGHAQCDGARRARVAVLQVEGRCAAQR